MAQGEEARLPPPKAAAFSLGASKAKSSPLARKPLTLSNGVKRPHSSLHDSDDDEEDPQARAQQVSSFDLSAGGAIGVNGVEQKAGPLVIPMQGKRNWMEESRRKKGRNILPEEVKQTAKGGGGSGGVEVDVLNGGTPATGLSLAHLPKAVEASTTEQTTEPARNGSGEDEVPSKPKTDDELALEALTSNGDTRRSTMVIAAPAESELDDNGRANMSEDAKYRRDVLSRPEPATLDQYEAVPWDQFGAALLRGMGWKEGEAVGRRKDVVKPREVVRRPNLLGIGAKEVPGGFGEGDDLSALGIGKRTKGKRKVQEEYNPLARRNKKTGEMISEEELKGRIEDTKRLERDGKDDSWKDRRDRNLKLDRDRKERRGGNSPDGSDQLRIKDGADDRGERCQRSRDGSRDDREDSRHRHSRDSSHSSRHDRHERSDSSRDGHRRRPRHDDDSDRDDDRHHDRHHGSRDRDYKSDRDRSSSHRKHRGHDLDDDDRRNASRSSSSSTRRERSAR